MKLIDRIKEIIYKVKDYDRLESDYCAVLDMATGAILSKPSYTIDSVREAINEYLYSRDSELQQLIESWINEHFKMSNFDNTKIINDFSSMNDLLDSIRSVIKTREL